jgi:hypothetical protein
LAAMLGGLSEMAEDFAVSGDRIAVDGATRPASGGASARQVPSEPRSGH